MNIIIQFICDCFSLEEINYILKTIIYNRFLRIPLIHYVYIVRIWMIV